MVSNFREPPPPTWASLGPGVRAIRRNGPRQNPGGNRGLRPFVRSHRTLRETPPPLNHPRDALEGKGRQTRPQKRLDRRLEEAAKAVGGGYCRLQMPVKLALAVRETVAGHRLGALEGAGVG